MATQEYSPADDEAIPINTSLPETCKGTSFGPYQVIVGGGFPIALQDAALMLMSLSSLSKVKLPG